MKKIIQRIYTKTNIPEIWRINIRSSKDLKMIKKEGREKRRKIWIIQRSFMIS